MTVTQNELITYAKVVSIQIMPNGIWYLDPEWKFIIRDVILDGNDLPDGIEWSDIRDMLGLEVKRRNARDTKTPDVVEWLYNTVTAVIDPATQQEEMELLKNVMEYLKAKNEGKKPEDMEPEKSAITAIYYDPERSNVNKKGDTKAKPATRKRKAKVEKEEATEAKEESAAE